MIAYNIRGYGDQIDWQSRERLLVRRDVVWDGEEVRFSGVRDREWLRSIGVLA